MDISELLQAKSDQLNADDLIGAPKTIVITGVKRVSGDQQMIINFEGDCNRPFKPSKTVMRILAAAWSTETDNWIGQAATLYCDPSVKWAGREVGGIRVSHLTGIKSKMSVKLAETRGVKKEFLILPLEVKQKPNYPQERINENHDAWKLAIQNGKLTAEQLINKCESEFILTDKQKNQIRSLGLNEDEEF